MDAGHVVFPCGQTNGSTSVVQADPLCRSWSLLSPSLSLLIPHSASIQWIRYSVASLPLNFRRSRCHFFQRMICSNSTPVVRLRPIHLMVEGLGKFTTIDFCNSIRHEVKQIWWRRRILRCILHDKSLASEDSRLQWKMEQSETSQNKFIDMIWNHVERVRFFSKTKHLPWYMVKKNKFHKVALNACAHER